MQVDTSSFEALTAEVEQLAAAVKALVQREVAVREIYRAGFAAGREEIRGAPQQHRPRRERPGYLRAVDSKPGGAA